MVLVSLACGAESAPQPQGGLDSAGVTIHAGAGSDAPLELAIERLGPLLDSSGVPFSFMSAHHRLVGTDSSGRVFALGPDASVLLFDSGGRFAGRLGRRGNGPGELQLPVSLTVSDGEISVHDAVRRALIRWDLDSRYLGDSLLAGPKADASTIMRFANGTIVERRLIDTDGMRQQLERADHGVLGSVSTPMREARFRCATLRGLSPLFAASLVWSANASFVGMSIGPGYVVDVVDARGQRRSLRRPLKSRAPQRQDVERLFPGGMRISLGSGPDCVIGTDELIAQQGMSSTMPIVTDLFVRANGETWVQRDSGTATIVDVFDHQGKYLGSTSALALPVAELLGEVLLVPEPAGDEGALTLQRIRLRRR
jgi:6-bladed beta-propeller